MNRHSTEDFQGDENPLHDATVVGMCHYTFAKTQGMYNTQSDPNGNYRLWAMKTCPCKFINCNTWTIWWGF